MPIIFRTHIIILTLYHVLCSPSNLWIRTGSVNLLSGYSSQDMYSVGKQGAAGGASRDAALDKATEQRHHLYEAETELEEEKGKNLRLMTQFCKDSENSSLPLEIIKAYKKLQEIKKCPKPA